MLSIFKDSIAVSSFAKVYSYPQINPYGTVRTICEHVQSGDSFALPELRTQGEAEQWAAFASASLL